MRHDGVGYRPQAYRHDPTWHLHPLRTRQPGGRVTEVTCPEDLPTEIGARVTLGGEYFYTLTERGWIGYRGTVVSSIILASYHPTPIG